MIGIGGGGFLCSSAHATAPTSSNAAASKAFIRTPVRNKVGWTIKLYLGTSARSIGIVEPQLLNYVTIPLMVANQISNVGRAVWFAVLILSWPMLARGNHLSITLDVTNGSATQTANTETDPPKTREAVVRPSMQTTLGTRCTAKFKVSATGQGDV